MDMPATRFAWHTLIASLLGLLPLLVLYVLLSPGFVSHLLGSGYALGQFARQVVTNGLPVVFIINYAGFIMLAWAIVRRTRGLEISRVIILLDLLFRVFLFIALHAFIYVISAAWFGSFGGDRLTALSVVGPTLARSALFENISGAYLYATLVSALPLYVEELQQTKWPQAFHFLPEKIRAIVLALILFGCFALALTLAAHFIVHLQSG